MESSELEQIYGFYKDCMFYVERVYGFYKEHTKWKEKLIIM